MILSFNKTYMAQNAEYGQRYYCSLIFNNLANDKLGVYDRPAMVDGNTISFN